MSFKKHLRDWLNPLTSYDQGSIQSTCDFEGGAGEEYHNGASIDIVVRDCSRQVSLTFSAHDLKWVKARKRKLDIMQKHLDNARSCLDLAEEYYSNKEKKKKSK